MAQEITVRHISSIEEFEGLREKWGDLVRQHEEKTAFLSWEWLYAWWKHYQGGKELWLITAWRDDTLIGIAPLMLYTVRKHGLRFRLLQTLGTPNIDQSDFIALGNDTEIIIALTDYILSQKNKFDAINLNEFKQEASAFQIIKKRLEGAGLFAKVKTNYHFHIPIQGTWEQYLRSLSKNTRRSIEKRMRRAQETFKVSLKYYRGKDVRPEHFETIFEINKTGHFSDKYKSENERGFLRELTTTISSRHWMEVAFLLLNDRPIAYEYGFNVAGRFEDWRTGYDGEYREHAPGTLLLVLLLKEMHEHGCYYDLDFLRGEYEYKEHWKPLKRAYDSLIVIRPGQISARMALVIIPEIWLWIKKNILRRREEN
jgi:CelD/BcsL family acetyltransferase involved in cellulose biosynthesis